MLLPPTDYGYELWENTDGKLCMRPQKMSQSPAAPLSYSCEISLCGENCMCFHNDAMYASLRMQSSIPWISLMKTSYAHAFTLYQCKIQVILKVNQLYVYHNVLIFGPKENNLSLIHGELPTWRTCKQTCIVGLHQSCLFWY